MIKSFEESKALREGKVIELPNEQKVMEVNTNTENNKVEKEDKNSFEEFKILYQERIAEKCMEDYGTIDDKNLLEDTAKELFMSSESYIPEETDKAEKMEESYTNDTVDISKYNTRDEIKQRIKEINKQIAYCKRRDKVTLSLDGEEEIAELEDERTQLRNKLRKTQESASLTERVDKELLARLDDPKFEYLVYFSNRIDDIEKIIDNCDNRSKIKAYKDVLKAARGFAAGRNKKESNEEVIEENKKIVEAYTAREQLEASLSKYEDEKRNAIVVLAETENYILTGYYDPNREGENSIFLSLTTGANRDKMYPDVYIDQDYKGTVEKAEINWGAYGSCSVEETLTFIASLSEAVEFCSSIQGKNFADQVKRINVEESKEIEECNTTLTESDSLEVNSIIVSYTSNQNYIKYFNLKEPITKAEAEDIKAQIKNKEMYVMDIKDKLGATEVKSRKELIPDTYVMKVREDKDNLDENKEVKTESQVSKYTFEELNKVINDQGNDFKLQITGSEDKTKWLNIDKDDLKSIYQALQNRNAK